MEDTSGVVRSAEVPSCFGVLLAGPRAVAAVHASLGAVRIPDAHDLHPGDDVGLLPVLPARVIPRGLGHGSKAHEGYCRNEGEQCRPETRRSHQSVTYRVIFLLVHGNSLRRDCFVVKIGA